MEVASAHMVEDVVVLVEEDVVLVEEDEVLVVVVLVVLPQSPLPENEDAGRKARGNPDDIGTAMLPLESTVTLVHVYASMSCVPDEYPLPLRVNVYELPLAPKFDSTVMTCNPDVPLRMAIVLLSW
jgi:hypothetical protein